MNIFSRNFVSNLLQRNKVSATGSAIRISSLSPLRLAAAWNLTRTSVSYIHTEQSHLRSNQNPVPDPHRPVALPSLMDFPLIMWPSILMTIRNWFFNHFVIRTYMDKEFDLEEFIRGARQAVSLVSNKLVSGELDDLEGLVDPNTLVEVKRKLATFSVYQRDLLSVSVEDIFFAFSYQIGIIIPDAPEPLHRQPTKSHVGEDDYPETTAPQRRFVEITVVFHVLRGFADKTTAAEMKSFQEFRSQEKNNVMVCNYRFLKDFTKGVSDPTWVINTINHFLPADYHQNS